MTIVKQIISIILAAISILALWYIAPLLIIGITIGHINWWEIAVWFIVAFGLLYIASLIWPRE